MALPQQNRLRSNRDFSRVHRKGKRSATRHLAIRALKYKAPVSIDREKCTGGASQKAKHQPLRDQKRKKQNAVKQSANGDPFALLSYEAQLATAVAGPKFGITISRKVSKQAVVRNRIKRQLKAIIRASFLTIDPAWQIVIVVRPPAVECSFDDFLRELEYLLQKLAIVKR